MLFDAADEAHIPIVLRGQNHYNVATETGYEMLYRRLTNQPKVAVPPVRGEIARLPPSPRKSSFVSVPGSTLRAVSLAECVKLDPQLGGLVDLVAHDVGRWKWERETRRVHELVWKLVEDKD